MCQPGSASRSSAVKWMNVSLRLLVARVAGGRPGGVVLHDANLVRHPSERVLIGRDGSSERFLTPRDRRKDDGKHLMQERVRHRHRAIIRSAHSGLRIRDGRIW